MYAADLWEGAAAALRQIGVDLPPEGETQQPGSDTPVLHAEPQTQAAIVGEDETKREADRKEFVLADGSRLLVLYGEAVHYLENGAWREIDNRFIEENGAVEEEAVAEPEVTPTPEITPEPETIPELEVTPEPEAAPEPETTLIPGETGETPLPGDEIPQTTPESASEPEPEYEGETGTTPVPSPADEASPEPETQPQPNPVSGGTQQGEAETSALTGDGATPGETEAAPAASAEPALTAEEQQAASRVIKNQQNGSLQVKLPKLLKANRNIEVRLEGYKLSFGFADDIAHSLGQASTLGGDLTGLSANERKIYQGRANGKVIYANIMPNVDAEYIVEGSRLKENIVLKAKPEADFAITYRIRGHKLEAQLEEDGSVTLMNGKSKGIVGRLQAPLLYDAGGNESADIEVTVNEGPKKGEYRITYRPDQDFLARAAYPVVLDPVIEAATGSANISDAKVCSGNPNTNYQSSLQAGLHATAGIKRFFIKYDNLPALNAADTIINAQLKLRCSEEKTRLQISAHQVLGLGRRIR